MITGIAITSLLGRIQRVQEHCDCERKRLRENLVCRHCGLPVRDLTPEQVSELSMAVMRWVLEDEEASQRLVRVHGRKRPLS